MRSTVGDVLNILTGSSTATGASHGSRRVGAGSVVVPTKNHFKKLLKTASDQNVDRQRVEQRPKGEMSGVAVS